MNLERLQAKLMTAARRQAPDDRVPYAFEKRITALLAARAVADHWAGWSRSLWRGAISCLALAVVVGTVSFFLPAELESSSDLSQDFENTLLASADQPDFSQMP
jgi:hypothetical protein